MRTRSGKEIHQQMMADVAKTYKNNGYMIIQEAGVNNGWVDVLAVKGNEKLGIECMVVPNYSVMAEKTERYKPYLNKLYFAFPKNMAIKNDKIPEGTSWFWTNIVRPKPLPTMQVKLDYIVEAELRTHLRRKGDLSRIVNEAVKEWLQHQEEKKAEK